MSEITAITAPNGRVVQIGDVVEIKRNARRWVVTGCHDAMQVDVSTWDAEARGWLVHEQTIPAHIYAVSLDDPLDPRERIVMLDQLKPARRTP